VADLNEQLAPWSILRSRIDTFRRIPDLLSGHPSEADAVLQLLATVVGPETDGQLECGLLWKAGSDDLATAIFVGNRWAITALHCVLDGAGCDYHVTLPANVTTDLHPKNSFHVMETFAAPGGIDAALLNLGTGLAPVVERPTIASAQEMQQANSVRICGFGSSNCQNSAGAGRKRISGNLTLATDPTDSANFFLANNGSETPVTCPSDSGGAVYLSAGGKIAGLVSQTITTPGQNTVTRCVGIAPLLPWIFSTTGLTF